MTYPVSSAGIISRVVLEWDDLFLKLKEGGKGGEEWEKRCIVQYRGTHKYVFPCPLQIWFPLCILEPRLGKGLNSWNSKARGRIREIHCDLKFGSGLLGMGRHNWSAGTVKLQSDYSRQMCVYCFLLLTSVITFLVNRNTTETFLCSCLMHPHNPLISSDCCPLRYQIMSCYRNVVIISRGTVALMSSMSVRPQIKHIPKLVWMCFQPQKWGEGQGSSVLLIN